jgi:hypothetical protein
MSLVIYDGDVLGIRVGLRVYGLKGCRLYNQDQPFSPDFVFDLRKCDPTPNQLIEDLYGYMFEKRGINVGHDPNYKLQVGNYKGWTLTDIAKVEPSYIVSRAENSYFRIPGSHAESRGMFSSYSNEGIALIVICASKEIIMERADEGSKLADPKWWESLGSFQNYCTKAARKEIAEALFEMIKFEEPLPYQLDFNAIYVDEKREEDMHRCRDFLKVTRRCLGCGEELDTEFRCNSFHERCLTRLKTKTEVGLAKYLA